MSPVADATMTNTAAATDTDADRRPDLGLARRAALGDRDAFAEIFRRHGRSLYRYAVRMLNGDASEAEDAVQDALAKAWTNIASFRGDAELRTWLFRLTINEVTNRRRGRRPIAVDDQLLEVTPAQRHTDPSQHVINRELNAALDAALTELPWRQRSIWLLREVEGLSYTEIADSLTTSPTVVRGQLHRARRTLAIRLEQWR